MRTCVVCYGRYIRLHNAKKVFPLDVVRLGASPDLPLGANDPAILRWAEQENRILISADRRTLAAHLAADLAAGHFSPGIFLMRSVPIREVVEFLTLSAYASEPTEWENRITFIP